MLAEGTPTPGAWLNATTTGDWAASSRKNRALRAQYDSLIHGGENASLLYYVDSLPLFRKALTPGPEGKDVNPTVCGVHSSDLGQYEIASFYSRFLPDVVGK